MSICRTDELRERAVVNLCNGECLGYASELEFNTANATVTALIIPGKRGFFGMGKEEDLILPWSLVECFGEDTVLVRLPEGFCPSSCCGGRKKNRRFFCR